MDVSDHHYVLSKAVDASDNNDPQPSGDKRLKMEIIYSAMTGYSLFFDSDEEEEGAIREEAMNGIDLIGLSSGELFKRQFGMRRETLQHICSKIRKMLVQVDTCIGRATLDPEKQVMIAVWTLASLESYSAVAERFEVCPRTARSCTLRVASALLQLNAETKIVSWPTEETMEAISNSFLEKFGFPGVAGCISSTHIRIKPPSTSPALYLNNAKKHSVILQAVCDDTMQFTDCYAGCAGSMERSTVFRQSSLALAIETKSCTFPATHHLLGSASYPVGAHMMVPYGHGKALNSRELAFNKKLKQALKTVRSAIALLKMRFRHLQFLDMARVDLIPMVIVACCVMHNICIHKNDTIEVSENDDETSEADFAYNESELAEKDVAAGIKKRDRIAARLTLTN